MLLFSLFYIDKVFVFRATA